jgi:hypothetical protein
LVLTSAAVARLLPTHSVFSGTYDEPFHIAAGIEWLDKGSYTYELLHPPLARVAVALGPYISGLHWPGSPATYEDWRAEGNVVLSAQGDYFRNLAMARLGTLPFLVLACVVVFLWTHRWFGRVAAVFALLLFMCLPPVLGHAGLATTDLPVAATVAAALYMLVRWLEQPDWPRTGLLSIALGAAVATKFSAVAFVPACVGAAAVYLAIAKTGMPAQPLRWRRHLFRFALAISFGLIFVWGMYRFSVRPLSHLQGAHHRIDKWTNNIWLRSAAYRVIETPLPLLDFYQGIRDVATYQELGYESYLLGKYSNTGWWYFFPVVLAVKTPIGFVLLSAGGLAAVLWKTNAGSWQRRLTAIFPVVILAVCMTSRIDSGVRHILPIYPPLAVLGGYAAARLVERGVRYWVSAVGLLLVAWAAADSVVAHPDYFAYFNPIASAHPENVLSETDLDWGQDLLRLAARLRDLGATQVTVKYFGTTPLDLAGLPPHQELSPGVPVSGYVAISVCYLAGEHAKDGSYDWLKRYRPLERVGRSIFLYSIP